MTSRTIPLPHSVSQSLAETMMASMRRRDLFLWLLLALETEAVRFTRYDYYYVSSVK